MRSFATKCAAVAVKRRESHEGGELLAVEPPEFRKEVHSDRKAVTDSPMS